MEPNRYDPSNIEKKWQDKWKKNGMYQADDSSPAKKFFPLVEFPFPSGAGLHNGHVRSYAAMDIIARKRRMEGYNVLYPIGWDAFGLPTENYAIKTGRQPKDVTKENTDTFRQQLQALGISFDWSREIDTTDPAYYKWTQWIFLQMHKKGLAYKDRININWCPKDKIGLANEEVIDGACERCGTLVEKKEKEQWMLAITKYADRLDKDLDDVDYWEKIKTQQRNWIGKSEGAEIDFKVAGTDRSLKVFTTRPDTLFGVTYIVLAPEHKLVQELLSSVANKDEAEAYIQSAKIKTEIDRTDATKEKTGVKLKGIKAINPASKEEVSVWIADYVLADYGTGAVMAVPAHDDRDFAFAKKYNLPIKEVIIERMIDKSNPHVPGKEIVFRDAIIAVVKNPATNKFLCLKWKKQPWTTFVMGGMEGDEDPITAAKREIQEETGYKNLKHVKTLRRAQSEFFAAHKDVNRVAHTRNLIFELENEERDAVSAEESEIHDLVWMSLEEIENTKMTHSEMPIIFEGLKNIERAYTDEGILINSGAFDKQESIEVKKKITEAAGGSWVTKYKLRDWVFSRQRYWGEPIPMINCASCGWVPVPEDELPVVLPAVEKYEPTDTGESPLAPISDWVNATCPKCKGPGKRETDTMPNWAGSSWYYLRYADPKNDKEFADKAKLDKWNPVDWYNGGMEHTTLHLLYSRFWHKFLFDIGKVPTHEPYLKRTSQGLVLAEGGEKMSKSKGNVVNPDDAIKTFGADSLRTYEMFMGPFDQSIAWNTNGLVGTRRFIEKVWKLKEKTNNDTPSPHFVHLMNYTIKKVTDDIEGMKFNTAISQLMIVANEMEKAKRIALSDYETFLKLLAPFAPHVTEELWSLGGHNASIHLESWPTYNPSKLLAETVSVAIQINGKTRDVLECMRDLPEDEVQKKVMELPSVKKWVGEKEIKRIVWVKNKIINLIVDL